MRQGACKQAAKRTMPTNAIVCSSSRRPRIFHPPAVCKIVLLAVTACIMPKPVNSMVGMESQSTFDKPKHYEPHAERHGPMGIIL